MENIFCGDCFDYMVKLDANSIDMILCDLPFSITDCKWDQEIDLNRLWVEYKRILKLRGVVALHSVQPFTTDLINSNRKWFKYSYIWIKSQAANFQLAKKMPLKKHEDVCIFYEGRPTYNPQMWKGKLKGKRIGKTVYQNRKSDMYLSSKPANLSIVKNDIYYPTTILNYPNVSRNKSIHPTQKPVELEEFLIKTYTNEGDTVLDNCAGSGTTGIAARNCNRKFILIEKEEKYYDKIIGRLNQK